MEDGKTNIQVMFSGEEMQYLSHEAAKMNLSVPLYIRATVLPNDGFVEAYRSLLERVDALSSGTRFSIPVLFGVDWTMSRGIKLNLGKTYYKEVEKGSITNVTAEGKDNTNIMWYVKK